ncbi:MAG: FliG C-terminal domain-containing protein [Candidatus Neomarinimicrobiota bacterium]
MRVADLTGLDKAAILFQVLGDGLAVTIFKELSDTDMRKIRVRARELEGVPFKIKKSVLEEFYFGFLAQKFKDTDKDARKPFAFLDKLSDEQVAYLILAEPPRIAAMVLAQLKPDRQMRIYERLDPEQRIETLTELGSGEAMNLEAVVGVAGDLRDKARYLPKASDFQRGGGEKLAGMLGQMSLEQADLFLDKLSQEDPELLAEVKKHYLTFEDIFKLDDTNLREILNSVELDDIPLAMKGMDESLVDQAINVLPKKKQAMYEPVEGAISKREVNDARRRIMEHVRKMQDDGQLNVAEILSGEVME